MSADDYDNEFDIVFRPRWWLHAKANVDRAAETQARMEWAGHCTPRQRIDYGHKQRDAMGEEISTEARAP